MSQWQLKTLKLGLIALVGITCILTLNVLFPPPLERAEVLSSIVTDRHGKPLRAFPTAFGGWRFRADLERIDPVFIDALLQVEDQRFYQHYGVDGLAILRATVTSVLAGHVVSGASTISMQTARLLEPRPRHIGSKLIEMLRAMQIEARLSKDEILELYLTLTPYGGNLEGIRAASIGWFGHEPDALSDDQIALLIALPQSPEVRRPDRRPQQAKAGRAFIASKLKALGLIDEQRELEINTALLPQRHAFPAQAWHAAAHALSVAGTTVSDKVDNTDIRSTLDAGMQADLGALLRQHAKSLDPDVQLAAMVVDIPTRAVRASIGSISRQRPGGWLDLTQQPRSPGSTLKPFIYAMNFDDGAAVPGTIINDMPKRFAAYRPDNFDLRFRGDVTIAEALQHSLNVPAVIALDQVGPERFAAQLRLAGANPRISGRAKQGSGLALALGGAGLTLEELTILYAALGDDGLAKPLVWRAELEAESDAAPGQRFVGADSAAAILQILNQAPTPVGRVPGRLTQDAPQVAFKTGTSYGFRDAWAAGVVGDKAMVVWVGRADGAPRSGHTGRTDALPILFNIADRTRVRLRTQQRNSDRLLATAATRPQAGLKHFNDDQQPPEILFPPNHAELWSGSINGKPARDFVLSGRGGSKLSWFVNGEPCRIDASGLPVWSPSGPGFYVISAVDNLGRETRVRVQVIV